MIRQSATIHSRHWPVMQLGVQGGISAENPHPPCFAIERRGGSKGR
jgi:hypothetical protein